MVRSGSIFRALLTFLFAYLFFIGATFNGVLLPELKLINLILLVIIISGWLATHYLSKWTWHSTPFDAVIALWGVAIIVSLVANSDIWRRILIGVWFVTLYIVVLYLLHDALSNRKIDRDTIIDSMLMGSLIVVFLGYVQVSSQNFDLAQIEFPRPGSSIGNPNSFGAFLIAIFPLSLARVILLKNRLAKIVLGLYTLALLVLLFLTFSRGAWLGGAVAIIVIGYLYLHQRRLLNTTQLRQWWLKLTSNSKLLIVTFLIVMIMIGLLGSVLVIDSLDTGGRDVSLRTNIYVIAIDLIAEQPLTGHGLFTFGQGYERLESLPPRQPHSHAHNIILNVGAEMGILGLIAIVGTVWVTLGMIRKNWMEATIRQRPAIIGAISAVFALGVHHLLDTPTMMPVIALVGLLTLSMATTSTTIESSSIQKNRFQLIRPIALLAMSVILLASGFWSAKVYQTYWDAIFLANEDNGRDYLGAAEAIQVAIEADPQLALYHAQQGFLYGMFVSENDDPDALVAGIEAYERYLELEPQSAVAWANLAGLYWQNGQQNQAMIALREAIELAPLSWQLQLNLGSFAEEMGNGDVARQAYQEALNQANYILPFWQETELRQDVWSSFTPTGLNLLQLAILDAEQLSEDDIVALWSASGHENRDRTDRYILELLLQLLSDNPQDLEDLLANAESRVTTDSDRALIHLGQAYLAQFMGEMTTYEAELLSARDIVDNETLSADFVNGMNIAFLQYLRFGISRQFLPQVNYPAVDTLLLRLLDQ